ncbi:hypothetical protein ACU686_44895 [Yinghuangia aomiensis]
MRAGTGAVVPSTSWRSPRSTPGQPSLCVLIAILQARTGHDRARAALAVQAPFEFELLQGLPQRGPDHAEAGPTARARRAAVWPAANSESMAWSSTVRRCQYFGSAAISTVAVVAMPPLTGLASRFTKGP